MRLPRNRGSSRFNRGTECERGFVMRTGRTLATNSDFPPLWWLLQAASLGFHRESDICAGRKRISTRIRRPTVPHVFYKPGRPECRERIWESSKSLLRVGQRMQQVGTLPKAFGAQQLGLGRDGSETLLCSQRATSEPAFVQESTTAPKLAVGPVVFRGAPAIHWQRVSSNPLPTGELLCTAIAVD